AVARGEAKARDRSAARHGAAGDAAGRTDGRDERGGGAGAGGRGARADRGRAERAHGRAPHGRGARPRRPGRGHAPRRAARLRRAGGGDGQRDRAGGLPRGGAVTLLSVADLRVRIAGSQILHGVALDVPASGVTVLLGRNGVGKTTTLKAILGLVPATGSVALSGEALLGRPTFEVVRRGLGYVPEDRGVFAGLTVSENLRLAQRRGQTPDYDTVYALFPELSARGRQRAGTLSGGQQQMLAIGRVLLNPNRLLLVDEPTKGLAPRI